MPQKTMAHSKGILEDSGLNINMPFKFFPHFIVFLINLFLLSTDLESFQSSDEQHLIKNKQLENKGVV